MSAILYTLQSAHDIGNLFNTKEMTLSGTSTTLTNSITHTIQVSMSNSRRLAMTAEIYDIDLLTYRLISQPALITLSTISAV